MAAQALKLRDDAVYELEESIRQAERYLASYNPSSRLVKQKAAKVTNLEEKLRKIHFSYCEKAEIDLKSDEARKFIEEKSDRAVDCVDSCLVFVEDAEFRKSEEVKYTVDEESKAHEETVVQGHLAQINSYENFATQLALKITAITESESLSEDHIVLMKTYVERIRETLENLEVVWSKIFASQGTQETHIKMAEITTSRIKIQESIGAGTVFIEKCSKEEASKEKGEERGNTLNNASSSHMSKEVDKGIKTEKLQYPVFSGDIRTFARFRKDFRGIVEPNVKASLLPYVLKNSCLKGDAQKLVENIDDLEGVWKRLEDKYGDQLDIVEVVVKELGGFSKLKGNDDVQFISLVDVLEKGLQDLHAIGARSEIANMFTVKLLESKLNRHTFSNWLKEEESMDGSNRFEQLFSFLKLERKRVEKIVLRNETQSKDVKEEKSKKKEQVGHTDAKPFKSKDHCLVHPNLPHFTRRCRAFLAKSPKERADIVKAVNACILCLSISHKDKVCPWLTKWKPCEVNECGQFHSHLLHDAIIQGFINMHTRKIGNNCLLLIQRILTSRGPVNAFYDNGSTITLVSSSFVIRNNLRGVEISYDLITVGGHVQTQNTYLHEIELVDAVKEIHVVQAYEIPEICGEVKEFNIGGVIHLFNDLKLEDVKRERGKIELLIGGEQLAIHPRAIDTVEGLVLFESIFGSKRVLGGTHPSLEESDCLNGAIVAKITAKIKETRVLFQRYADPGVDGITAEQFGVMILPRCGNCMKCKVCTAKGLRMSRLERRELTEIEKRLQLDPIAKRWSAGYPLRCDPIVLGDNVGQAVHIMKKMESRVLKDEEEKAKPVEEQYQDFIKRGVYSEISEEEDSEYTGPRFHVSVHEVANPDSSSTPLRLVTNSSLKYKGVSLNDILMKGPNNLNDIFFVQLRFRCYPVPLVGDISKMYHSVYTGKTERHLRRVVWRHLDPTSKIKVYGTNTVAFGDRPAAAITTIAMKKTAEIYEHINPEAAQKIKDESYVDDIATGAESVEQVEELKAGIVEILSKGGFRVKGFVTSGDVSSSELALLGTGDMGRILGIVWDPKQDILKVRVRINLSKKGPQEANTDLKYEEIPSIMKMKITRRIMLSINNSCYDPLGLLTPITVQLKLELKQACQTSGWDEALSEETKTNLVSILSRLKEAEQVSFRRCVKPENAKGDPDLIVCNDGSDSAMCATTHIRWECEDGSVCIYLWCSKTRVTPVRKMTTPKIELQSAVLATRLSKSVQKSSIWNFNNVYHVIDSECVLNTLNNDTLALDEFSANRVDEILDSTKADQWYHVRSRDNIADLATRESATVRDVDESSAWQNGLAWMYQPKDRWPVSQIPRSKESDLQVTAFTKASSSGQRDPWWDFASYKGKSYQFYVNVVAHLIHMRKSKSLKGGTLEVDDLEEAEHFLIKQSMMRTKVELEKGHLMSLRPVVDDDGIIKLGGRALEGLEKYYENKDFPILVYKDPLSYLWIKSVHKEDHSGVKRTVAKSRRKFWIIKAPRLAAEIKRSCYRCRIIDKILAKQLMAPLPVSRQVMSPTFHEIALDLFGPMEVKGTVKSRTRKKVWGMIISCVVTRALHIDVSEDYGADSVIQTLRKFTSLRGCPAKIISDKGSQLLCASEEIKRWAVSRKIKWVPVPSEGQHQNGVSEALVKSVKRSLQHVIGSNIFSFSSLQMMFFEVADVINSRPIGILEGSDPTQPTPLTPNHLLLGRCTSEVVTGVTDTNQSFNKRYRFLQTLVNDWWKRWYENVLPSLVPSYKWLQRHRNVQPGDVCLIKYKNELKGRYRLGRVKSVKMGDDGCVRTATLVYKNANENVFRTVDRPIHGLAVIVPIEEQSDKISTSLDPGAVEFNPSE